MATDNKLYNNGERFMSVQELLNNKQIQKHVIRRGG